jgi:ribosomal protein S27AE
MPDRGHHTEQDSRWTRYDYPGLTTWQRECEKCDRGLLLAPARFCPACAGSDFIVSHTEPDDA